MRYGGQAIAAIVVICASVLAMRSVPPQTGKNRPAKTLNLAASENRIAFRPVEILGIIIDRPVTLPDCKKADLDFIDSNHAWQAPYHGNVVCSVKINPPKKNQAKIVTQVDPAFADRKEYHINIPDASKPSYIKDVTVSTLHNKVAEILIKTNGESGQDQAFTDLTAKFNTPQNVANEPLQNGFGMQLSSINAHWFLTPSRVSISFEGIAERRDTGYLILRSQTYRDAVNDFDARHPQPHL